MYLVAARQADAAGMPGRGRRCARYPSNRIYCRSVYATHPVRQYQGGERALASYCILQGRGVGGGRQTGGGGQAVPLWTPALRRNQTLYVSFSCF
jgi:hypothetical protein